MYTIWWTRWLAQPECARDLLTDPHHDRGDGGPAWEENRQCWARPREASSRVGQRRGRCCSQARGPGHGGLGDDGRPCKGGVPGSARCPAAERRCATGRSSKDEDTSAPAARDLIESGYEPERVAALRGGLFACNEEGYPVKWYDQW